MTYFIRCCFSLKNVFVCVCVCVDDVMAGKKKNDKHLPVKIIINLKRKYFLTFYILKSLQLKYVKIYNTSCFTNV